MPTFANTIDNNEILAKRSQCDYAGNDIQTTYATKVEVTTGLSGKQDTISDLSSIRAGAALGATAVQPGDLATVATTGAYSDLSGTPTIPPELSAGNGIDITNNVVSADIDGTSLTNGANGLSVTLPVPDTTGASQGDVLSVGQSGIEWVAPSSGSSDLFYATISPPTTFNEIQNAVNDGKYVILSHQGFLIPLTAIIGTGSFAKAYFQTINNPKDKSSSNSLRLGTYTCDYNSAWRWYNTFVPPTASASDAGKVLTVNSSGTAEWATPSGGGSVTDVEVNGSSVVNASGVAEVTVPAQVNADWNSSSGASEILNKPTIPAAQVNSDWNASSGVAEILNKPTILPYKPVVAGTGVRIVDDTANNRIVVEADETVLWESQDSAGHQTVTLSESKANFERIKILVATNNGTTYGLFHEIPSNMANFNVIRGKGATNVWMSWIRLEFTNDTTLTVVSAKSFNFGAQSDTSWVNPSVQVSSTEDIQAIWKVVGINRIASN